MRHQLSYAAFGLTMVAHSVGNTLDMEEDHTLSLHFVRRQSCFRLMMYVACIGMFLFAGEVVCFTAPKIRSSPAMKPPRRIWSTHDSLFWILNSSHSDEQDNDVTSLERQVMASTRARLDLKRVTSDLLGDETLVTSEPTTVTESLQTSSYYSPWKVAIAAGGVAAAVSFGVWHSWTVSAITWIAIFFVANGDPLEEDSVAGALARVVGRATLKSVEASQPKVRAVARAAVRGEDDFIVLQQRIELLEQENKQLRLWQKRRQYVEQALPSYTLEDLKILARQHQLAVGGTKSQLLMRLVEADVIDIS